MSPSVSIVIGVFGDLDHWGELAWSRAIPSAQKQTVEAEIVYSPGDTLAQARNNGIERASGDLIIILDADDELDPGYVEAMGTTHQFMSMSCLYQPRTLGVYPDGREDAEAVFIPERDLKTGNYLVIGTAFQKERWKQVGGFKEWPVAEDWDFFWRMSRLPCSVVQVPDAIYRVHVRPDSRNKQPQDFQQKVFREIRRANG